jgi:amino acid adenylation domain-containing protein
MLDFILKIKDSFLKFPEKESFVIQGKCYSYQQLGNRTSDIQHYLQLHYPSCNRIGIICNDSIDTYAAFLAIIFSGKTFVPILPHYPASRNKEIVNLADIDIVISPDDFTGIHQSSALPVINLIGDDDILAILFTSGSTGTPKGVPYSKRNMDATLDAFFKLSMKVGEDDRFLQMFDLNFDMSYLSFLPALMMGASVYTVGNKGIKYLEAVKLMMTEQISVATVVPSTLRLLEPYMDGLNLPQLRYSMVGGEPFSQTLCNKWLKCGSSGDVFNISGPTETTMACMGYWVPRTIEKQKTHNGILAFGLPWPNTMAVIVDNNNKPVVKGVEGELAFSGDNVMKGYLKLDEVNEKVFCRIDGKLFYKTGDLAFIDDDGIFHTCGRRDDQVKILGFKVELGEIEYHLKQLTGNEMCVVKYFSESRQIIVFVENKAFDFDENIILERLKERIPPYMIPGRIIRVDSFSTTNNGKIDKTKLLI